MKTFVNMVRVAFFVFLTTALFSGCASTTVIQSSPSGAKVFLNGSYVGVTPYTMRDTKIVWTKTHVKLVKNNYQPFTTTIVKNEAADIGPIIGGFFVTVPWLWFMKYKPQHNYVLLPEK